MRYFFAAMLFILPCRYAARHTADAAIAAMLLMMSLI